MKQLPPDQQRLSQLMDACRVGRDDLSRPEMAELALALRDDAALRSAWELRQQSERAVSAAMHDVAPPTGLAERIVAAVRSREAPQAPDSVAQALSSEAQPASAVTARSVSSLPPQRSRRRWLLWTAGIAAALVLAVTTWNAWQPPALISKVQLENYAQAWFDAAVKDPKSRQPASDNPPVKFPNKAVVMGFRSWQRVPDGQEANLVAFELANPGFSGSVFLFVAPTSKKYDVAETPFTRLTATRGLEIGAWQQGGVLYVVVVDTKNSGLHLENVLRQVKLASHSHYQVEAQVSLAERQHPTFRQSLAARPSSPADG